MLQTKRVLAQTVGSTCALAIVLIAIKTSLEALVPTLIIFSVITILGEIVSALTTNKNTPACALDRQLHFVTSFLIGAVLSVVAWQLFLLIGYLVLVILLIGIIALIHKRSKRHENRLTSERSLQESLLEQIAEWISVSLMALLLLVMTIPGLRWLSLLLVVLTVAFNFKHRRFIVLRVIGLAIVVLIVRESLYEKSILLFSDDTIFAEAYSSSIRHSGFWSWAGASDVYNRYHWLSFGLAGWFVDALHADLFTVIVAVMPAIFCVLLASTVEHIYHVRNSRIRQVALLFGVCITCQLYGSQSLSADLGFICFIALVILNQTEIQSKITFRFLLVGLVFTKLQFVPIVLIILLATTILNWNRHKSSFFGNIFTLSISIAIARNLVPISQLFNWNLNSDWGQSLIGFRSWNSLSLEVLTEIVRPFGASLFIFLVYFAVVNQVNLRLLLAPITIVCSSIFGLAVFEIANSDYLPWAVNAYVFVELIRPILNTTSSIANFKPRKKVLSIVLLIAFGCSITLIRLENRTLTVLVLALLLLVFLLSIFTTHVIPGISVSNFVNDARKFFQISSILVLFIPLNLISLSKLSPAQVRTTQGGLSLVELGIDSDLLDAGKWIDANTSTSEVIATNVLCEINESCVLDGRPLVAAVSHRRTYIESERFVVGRSPGMPPYKYPQFVTERLTASHQCAEDLIFQACDKLRRSGVSLMLVDTEVVGSTARHHICKIFGKYQVVYIGPSEGSKYSPCDNH